MTETDAAANSSRDRKRRDNIVWRTLQVVALLSCLPTLGSIGARYWWVFDLMTHFRAYYAIALTVFSLMLIYRRKWPSLAVCVAALAFNASQIVPLYLHPAASSAEGSRFRCLVANVNSGNLNHTGFLNYVRQENPDVLIVIEVNDHWNAALAPLARDYPHVEVRPQSGNFGIAFYSRLPTESIEIREFGGPGLPSVVARVKVEEREVTIIGTHTVPPMNARWTQKRNDHLMAIAHYVHDVDGPTIVMGDLNCTSWSPHFADFLSLSGLSDSRRGFGIQPSWTGNTRLMAIPIDHVLVSPEINVLERRIGSNIGSDHLPMVVDLSIANSGS